MRHFFISCLCALLFSACGNVEESSESLELIRPLTPAQQQKFELTIERAGRLERSMMLNQGSLPADQILTDLRTAIMSGSCTIQNNLHSGQFSFGIQSLSVTGTNCPVSMRAERSTENGSLRVTATFEIKRNDLIIRNQIRSLTISGQGQSRLLSGAQGIKTDFSWTGTIVDVDGKVVSLSGRTNLRRFSRTNGSSALEGTHSIQLEMSGIYSELKMVSDGFEKRYYLNTDRVNDSVFTNYLSRLGPLLSGGFTDAG